MREIWVERRKWPDRPHYSHRGWVLGEDDYGVWIQLRPGEPVYRGEEIAFYGSDGGLMCAPRAAGWLARFPDRGELDLYVDIVTGISHSERAITMVDLDLDVIRYRSGEVKLVDEDEFERHQVDLAYPAPIIEAACKDAEIVLSAVRNRIEPFGGGRARKWAQSING